MCVCITNCVILYVFNYIQTNYVHNGLLVLEASVSSCIIIEVFYCYSAGHSFSLSLKSSAL